MNQSHLRLPPAPRARVMGQRQDQRGDAQKSLPFWGWELQISGAGRSPAALSTRGRVEPYQLLQREMEQGRWTANGHGEERSQGKPVCSPLVACASAEHMGTQVGGRKCFRVRWAVSTEN